MGAGSGCASWGRDLPEYVYEIGGASIFPDNRRFGVLWMDASHWRPPSTCRRIQRPGRPRDAGASKPQVLLDVDRAIERYGGIGAFGREDQLSDQFLEGEIEETQVTSTILPAIFLASPLSS